jgi:hypothetical protein
MALQMIMMSFGDKNFIMEKKNYGKRNRSLGHRAEVEYAKKFRELGFDKCVTSRQGSRLHDDAKIDLIFLPYNVQIKAGKQRGLNPITVLKEMEAAIKEKFPDNSSELKNPNMIIVKKATGKGVKRTKYDDIVVMSFEDFKEFIKYHKKVIDNDKNQKNRQ